MKNLLQIKDSEVNFVACDEHPMFITTRFAKELSVKFKVKSYPIQHHFAHVLSLMAENKVNVDEKIVGISTDGVGFGDDGNIWGGEILLTSYYGYERLGHLQYQPMVGGDRCTKYPARMAASIILKVLGIEKAREVFNKLRLEKDLEYKSDELNALISQFEKNKNVFPSKNIPLSSSTGRILDVVSYLVGASNVKTYRGEPAMRLEALATRGDQDIIPLNIEILKKDGMLIINSSKLILDILDLINNKMNNPADIAAKFQKELALAFSRIAKEIAELRGISKIGLTGGVAYNLAISNTIKEDIISEGFEFLEHNLIPPGDAGISSGQLIGGIFKYNENF
jgi:hydrogenase maturation protein HypF